MQFGYSSRLQAWAPILIPLVFFVLGRAAGPLVERIARRVGNRVAARVRFGRRAGAAAGRQEGVILSRETLARIAPGRTTREEVLEAGHVKDVQVAVRRTHPASPDAAT